MSVRNIGTPVRISASGKIASGPCQLLGILVNSTSSGTITLYDATSATGSAFAAITPPVNVFTQIPAACATGLYCTVGGTLNATFFVAAG